MLEASGDLGLQLEGVPRHATLEDAEAAPSSVVKVGQKQHKSRNRVGGIMDGFVLVAFPARWGVYLVV